MAPEELTEDDRAQQYAAWAERMRTKRAAAKARIAADQQAVGAAAGATGAPRAEGAPGPTYWTTDALFAESRRVGEQEAAARPDPTVVAELLAVLDLREGADPDQLAAAYRRAAKAHHPDRFVHADEATRRFHEERMLEINRAHGQLRALLGQR